MPARLETYLDALLEAPEDRATLVAEIQASFGETCAVFVSDMSGFTAIARDCGDVEVLVMIRRLQRLALPVVVRLGRLVKAEADDIFAAFPTVDAAVAAALEIHERLAIVNLIQPTNRQLRIAVGIGYGPILNDPREHTVDIWGHEVNLASRLGEDIGHGGETLLTDAARAAASGAVQTVPRVATSEDKVVTFHQVRA